MSKHTETDVPTYDINTLVQVEDEVDHDSDELPVVARAITASPHAPLKRASQQHLEAKRELPELEEESKDMQKQQLQQQQQQPPTQQKAQDTPFLHNLFDNVAHIVFGVLSCSVSILDTHPHPRTHTYPRTRTRTDTDDAAVTKAHSTRLHTSAHMFTNSHCHWHPHDSLLVSLDCPLSLLCLYFTSFGVWKDEGELV